MRFVTHSHTAACCLFGGCFNIYRHTERFDESARNSPSTSIEHRWFGKEMENVQMKMSKPRRGYRPTYCAVHFIMFLLRFTQNGWANKWVNARENRNEHDMKEFPSYVFVWLGSSSLNLKLFIFFLSPLANYKSMEEPRKKNGTHEHFFPSHHSTPCHTVYKPSWYVLMHKMFIYDSISSRSCIHSLQFFLLVRFRFFLISKAI